MGCYPSVSHKGGCGRKLWLKSQPGSNWISPQLLNWMQGSLSASPVLGGYVRELTVSKSSYRLLLLSQRLLEFPDKPIFSVVVG